MEKRWVQHMSGQGEKWKLTEFQPQASLWRCENMQNTADDNNPNPWLPRSEYHICEPPDVWRDVTSECDFVERESCIKHRRQPTNYIVFGTACFLMEGYRIRKVSLVRPGSINGNAYAEQWAFIVERREP